MFVITDIEEMGRAHQCIRSEIKGLSITDDTEPMTMSTEEDLDA